MYEIAGAPSGLLIDGKNPSHRRTSLDPLLEVGHIRCIRKLDVHLSTLDDDLRDSGRNNKNALDGVEFITSPLPALESFSFYADQYYAIKIYPKLPKDLFSWESLPPTKVRHLALHGCFRGPTQSIRNLASFELSGLYYAAYRMELDQKTFLPFISASPSLASLSLAHCTFPDREELSGVTPVKLPELKTLRLMGTSGLSRFLNLVDVPAFRTLSSLRVLVQEPSHTGFSDGYFMVRAESDDGFQLSYDTRDQCKAASRWLGLTHHADPVLAFVRVEGRDLGSGQGVVKGISLLQLLVNAEVLEFGASFISTMYCNFWKKHGFWEDLEKVGPQLTTVRLEVAGVVDQKIAKSVENLVKARFRRGMPLTK